MHPVTAKLSGFSRPSHRPSRHPNRSVRPCRPPLHCVFSKPRKRDCESRMALSIVVNWQRHTGRLPAVGVRLGHRACGPMAAPLAAGARLKARGNLACGEDFRYCEKEKPPGELQAPIAWFIPKVLLHHTTNARTITGSASPTMVESRAVLRHCPGQHPKGALMDAQTVIAVCELLLVVVALVELIGRRDE